MNATSLFPRAAGVLLVATALAAGAAPGTATNDELRVRAATALRSACGFFRERVATEGGYLWRYSEDLSAREGENRATATQVWVQPPGTPSVGGAFLAAYEATKDAYYLDAARDAGRCLVRGQLRSGGWTYKIEFDPALRAKYAYRADAAPAADAAAKAFNVSTLDDDTTQAPLRFLARLDAALGFKDAAIHEAVLFGLKSLLAAQYPNGAWAQRFAGPAEAAGHPVCRASYPDAWSRTFPKADYSLFYTLNDNSLADAIDTLFLAARIYRDDAYAAAARRGGDFLLLAQMPDPQPGWAQQYDPAMHPAWARKFEPPAVTGCEAQGVIATLHRLFVETGDRKYLEPVPRALAYYRKSLLPDGRLARFYELRTNRPLYFTKTYELTGDDRDMPTHYCFKVDSRLDRLEAEQARLAKMDEAALRAFRGERDAREGHPGRPHAKDVEEAIRTLDDRGRWIEDGNLKDVRTAPAVTRVIDCATFTRRATALARFLAAGR